MTTKFADLKAKAHEEGAKAWRYGVATCPYASSDLAQAWYAGWNEAQEWAVTENRIPAEDGVYADITDTVYHSDRHSLSSSGAKTILEPGGPAVLRWAPAKTSAAFDYGHAAHELVLGKGSGIAVVDAKDWRTKDAKAAQDAAHDAGKTPMLRKDYDRAVALADAVKSHPLGEVLFAEGVAEQSIWAHDELSGARIRCRPDWWVSSTFIDLKTATDPGRFDRAIEDYSYHLSAAYYLHVARSIGVQVDSFILIAVGKTSPFLVDVCELSSKDLSIGQELTRAAIDLFAHCQRADTWPGLPAELRTATLPDRIRYRADDAIQRAANAITEGTRA